MGVNRTTEGAHPPGPAVPRAGTVWRELVNGRKKRVAPEFDQAPPEVDSGGWGEPADRMSAVWRGRVNGGLRGSGKNVP